MNGLIAAIKPPEVKLGVWRVVKATEVGTRCGTKMRVGCAIHALRNQRRVGCAMHALRDQDAGWLRIKDRLPEI